ncbi:MAG: hypothetical protein WAJ85_06055 [Candidatus Baltobacteraceae bacterium]
MASLLVAALAATVIVTSPQIPALAFDTGPHASITIDSVMSAGLNRNAANVVQVENWLTDYYTNKSVGEKKCDLEKLHFDDLFSAGDIQRYWTNFWNNTVQAVGKSDSDRDVLEFYVVLGVSLHAVQDFYSHSNWVDQNGVSVQPGHYSTKTYFQTPNPKPAGLHTGWYDNCLDIPQDGHEPHGNYTSGLNHDSVVRPGYDQAYVYAYAASYEWTKNLLAYLSPGFRAEVMSYAPSSSDLNNLAYDQAASICISEFIQTPSGATDGHWNGNRSGQPGFFTECEASWDTTLNSIFVNRFNDSQMYATLSQNLYSPRASTSYTFTPYPIRGAVFEMRTLSAGRTDRPGGTSDPHHYAGELQFLHSSYRPQQGDAWSWYRDAGQPLGPVPWKQLIFLSEDEAGPGRLQLMYTLWDESGWAPSSFTRVPLKLGGTGLTLTFTCLLTADWSAGPCIGPDIAGGPWTQAKPYATNGTGVLGLYFTSSPADR